MHARMLVALALAMLPLAARGQDSVALLRTARVDPGRPVVLGDIAMVRGPHCERLAGLVVAPDPAVEPADEAGWFTIGLGRVQAALGAEMGPKAGMVALSGSACSVRVVGAPATEPGPAAPAEPPAAADSSALVALMTVRGAVARELCRILDVEPGALRLSFEDEDRAFLDGSVEGRVLEISPAGSSARMPVAVTVHEASGRMVRRTVRVDVEVLRTVAIASRSVERGRGIEAADIAAEARWLALGARAITPDEAAGAIARRRIKPGEQLDAQAIEPPVAIARGDRVWVRVVTRGLVVRREGHALEDGREGEEISFAAVEDSRQRFRAIVAGPGDAVVWTGPEGGTGLASFSGGE
ncbi:MAG TPA: flagellar basal body P-ring formation chaperone FlgA [Phycisphaerales bacterium]|nr:flagellar basal body P-ring formation chaperone FlgA [Phycisphaerales bacterium]